MKNNTWVILLFIVFLLAACTSAGGTPTPVIAVDNGEQDKAWPEAPTSTPPPLRFDLPTPGAEPISGWRPPLYPVPWADDASVSALVTEAQARTAIEAVGLQVAQWIGKVQESVKFFERVIARIEAKGHPPLGIHLILGDNAEDKIRNHARNLSQNRLSVVVGSARKQ